MNVDAESLIFFGFLFERVNDQMILAWAIGVQHILTKKKRIFLKKNKQRPVNLNLAPNQRDTLEVEAFLLAIVRSLPFAVES